MIIIGVQDVQQTPPPSSTKDETDTTSEERSPGFIGDRAEWASVGICAPGVFLAGAPAPSCLRLGLPRRVLPLLAERQLEGVRDWLSSCQ